MICFNGGEPLDESLKDVDPLDPNISVETKAKILEECHKNFSYYLKRIAFRQLEQFKKPTKDIIQMDIERNILNKEGNPIEIKTCQPEYINDSF